MSDELYKISDGLLAVSSFYICLELFVFSLNGTNSSKRLNTKEHFCFEIAIFLKVVMIELLLKVVFVRELPSGNVSNILEFLH